MRSLVFANSKGGAGKTTSAVNVAVGLAKRGSHVLVVDMDGQGNASLVLLSGQPPAPPTIGAVLLNEADAAEAVRPTNVPGLDIIPADATLADAEVELAGEMGRERRLRLALDELASRYDFVVVDTSPSLSLATVNALNFAEEVIVPVDAGLFALAGLGRLQETVAQVRQYLDNRALRITGVVMTRVQSNNVSRDVEAQLREAFGEILGTIPLNVAVEEAHSRFQSVLDYAPRSNGAKSYAALVGRIVDGQRAKDGARVGSGESAAPDDRAA